MTTPLAERLTDSATDVVVCVGSGGVGKTTTAAALGLHAAEQGRRVAVLTIDPARRLAQALGADAVDPEPHRVVGVETVHGEPAVLDVLLLDMRRTFDDVVRAHAPAERVEAILTHPLYESLASSLAGTQEYMAMERLGQLREEMTRTGRWDLLVVDTPPSRSALDFLDAPRRLGRFVDGRLVRVLSAPARLGSRAGLKVVGGGFRLARGVVGALLGGSLVADVQVLLSALESVLGGFRERADRTYAALTSSSTAFVVVTSTEDASVTEAEHLVERLGSEGITPAAIVVTRVVRAPGDPTITAALEALDRSPGPLAEAALEEHVHRARRARRHAAQLSSLRAKPGWEASLHVVPDRGTDVHDLLGLEVVARDLTSARSTPGAGRRAR